MLQDLHKLDENGHIIPCVAQTKHMLILHNVVKSIPYFGLIKPHDPSPSNLKLNGLMIHILCPIYKPSGLKIVLR